MDKEQLLNIASQCKRDMNTEILSELVNISEFRAAKKGELLAMIGDEAQNVGLVLNGIVRCYYVDGNGNDITRGFSAPGSFCMEEGILGYRERLTQWEALEETNLMTFHVKEIKKLISENEQLKNTYMSLLENSLRYKVYRESTFLVENATERYIHFRKLYPEICANVKQKYIATYLGIKPESLSRIRKAMKEAADFDDIDKNKA